MPVELGHGLKAHVCNPENLIIYKLISTRSRDHEDAASVVRRQGDALDDEYVLEWLRKFEQALDDSTFVAEYLRMRRSIVTDSPPINVKVVTMPIRLPPKA